MATLFHQGGPTMFLILMLVLPGLVLAILHGVFAAQWSRWTSLGILALILVIGMYGCMDGRSRTDEALAYADPTYRNELREQGYLEASRPIQLAGVVCGLLSIGFVIGEIRRRRRRAF